MERVMELLMEEEREKVEERVEEWSKEAKQPADGRKSSPIIASMLVTLAHSMLLYSAARSQANHPQNSDKSEDGGGGGGGGALSRASPYAG